MMIVNLYLPRGIIEMGADNEASVSAVPRDVRASILRAAATLFAERGYNATSVREVVEAAGCRKPTLYYYFDNKEKLYLEVIRSCCDCIIAVIEAALLPPGTVRERFGRALTAYLDHVHSNVIVLRLLMAAERHPDQGQPLFDFDALRKRYVKITRAILEAGVESQELRADLDVEEAVLSLFGMVDHRLVLFLHGRPIPEDYPDRVLELFFNGVGA